MSETFVCQVCRQEFPKARSDEDAMSEAQTLWTEAERSGAMSVVCEDCFNDFMAWLARHPEIRRQS